MLIQRLQTMEFFDESYDTTEKSTKKRRDNKQNHVGLHIQILNRLTACSFFNDIGARAVATSFTNLFAVLAPLVGIATKTLEVSLRICL